MVEFDEQFKELIDYIIDGYIAIEGSNVALSLKSSKSFSNLINIINGKYTSSSGNTVNVSPVLHSTDYSVIYNEKAPRPY